MPWCALFVRVGNSKERLFAQWLAEQLQADGQFRLRREPARQDQTADPREVARKRENIREIHLQWVIGFLADLKGRGRSGRCYDGIDLLEGAQKILSNEGTHFLGSQVKGVVVAAA